MKRKIEKRSIIDSREVRFTNFIDEENRIFEKNASVFLTETAIDQTVAAAEHTDREYYLMQTRTLDGSPGMQAIIYVGRPRWLTFFALATVPNLPCAKNGIEEEFGLKCLRNFCKEIAGVMTLRVQPQRFDPQELINFQARANRCNFQVVSPLGVVRTLLLKLHSSAEELLAKLPGKTRQKFRSPALAQIELRVLQDLKWKTSCELAGTESRLRSGSRGTSYDYEMAFRLAKSHPDRARIVGLFFKNRPEQLLAYVIGYRTGRRCEYSSAGSINDTELRKIPFNYFLVLELANWARDLGCTEIDLGGITDGGENDPLQGISRFKRSLAPDAQAEFEIGREMTVTIRPFQCLIYRFLKRQHITNPHTERLQPIYD